MPDREVAEAYAEKAGQSEPLGQGIEGLIFSYEASDRIVTAKALRHFKRSAAEFPLNNVSTATILGSYYLTEPDGKDVKSAMQYFQMAALYHDSKSEYEIARIYESELEETQNKEQAMHWYTRASEDGYLDAQLRLGEIYTENRNNYPAAVHQFKKALLQGFKRAELLAGLSVIKSSNRVPAEHCIAATSILEDFAAKNDVDALLALGQIERGETACGNENLKKAFHYFIKAANRGSAVGAFYAANVASDTRSHADAEELYLKAIRLDSFQHDLDGAPQHALGAMYSWGWGEHRTYGTFLKYELVAALSGYDDSLRFIYRYVENLLFETAFATMLFFVFIIGRTYVITVASKINDDDDL